MELFNYKGEDPGISTGDWAQVCRIYIQMYQNIINKPLDANEKKEAEKLLSIAKQCEQKTGKWNILTGQEKYWLLTVYQDENGF